MMILYITAIICYVFVVTMYNLGLYSIVCIVTVIPSTLLTIASYT